MPSGFRRLIGRLRPSQKAEQNDGASKPFDPFDPIHDAPKQINFSDVLDLEVMIQEVKAILSRTEDDLRASPSQMFLNTCETCIECLESECPEAIGTLEWFNMARRAQLDENGHGKLSLCYICWAVLRLRLRCDTWSIGEVVPSDQYYSSSQWKTLKSLAHPGAYTIFTDSQISPEIEQPMQASTDMRWLTDLYSRLVPVSAPKFDIISSWLHECHTTHHGTCVKPLIDVGMDRDLTLIDVKQCCLVKAPGNSRYATLSYVWGKDWQLLHVDSNHDALFRPGALVGTGSAELTANSNAPLGKVVTDTMAITSQIGERYLWIDALCIKQDEGEAKALELMRMASIYNCAIVTIVPIDGASSHTPIPGLGSVQRGKMADNIFDGASISVKKGLDQIITGSVYNTRGWCFQEAFLSRRSLFFSEQQVFFRCQEATWSEDLLSGIQPLGAGYKAVASNLRAQGEGNTAGMSTLEALQESQQDFTNLHTQKAQNDFMRSYGRLTDEYWSRSLTSNNDVMDAFSAISSALEILLSTHIWAGLPEKFFHHFLLWEIRIRGQCGNDEWTHPHSSRAEMKSAGDKLIPSWSWMGWRSYCSERHEDTFIRSGVSSSMLQAAASLGPQALVPLISGLQIEERGQVQTIQVHATAYDQDVNSSSSPCPHFDLRPGVSSMASQPKLPVGHNILRFWASVASLASLGVCFTQRPDPKTPNEPNARVVHDILDSEGLRCGRFNGIALNDVACSIYPRADIVILSCTTWNKTKIMEHSHFEPDQIFQQPPYEIANWKSLNFMLVYWKEDGSSCQRLGIGEIHVDAFSKGVLQEKYIRLE